MCWQHCLQRFPVLPSHRHLNQNSTLQQSQGKQKAGHGPQAGYRVVCYGWLEGNGVLLPNKMEPQPPQGNRGELCRHKLWLLLDSWKKKYEHKPSFELVHLCAWPFFPAASLGLIKGTASPWLFLQQLLVGTPNLCGVDALIGV